MMAEPWTCVHCGDHVLLAVDSATGERVVLDRDPVQGGPVLVLNVGRGLIARDYVTTPAPRQPAHQLHDRSCERRPVTVPDVDLDDDPGLEQSRGWRQ